MYLQRLACGWRSDEVQRWVELGKAGQKTLYWVVSRTNPLIQGHRPRLLNTNQQLLAEELSDRQALSSKHVAKFPQVRTEA